MPLAPFPIRELIRMGRPPTRYDLSQPNYPKTVHKFDDGMEINRESDVAEYHVKIFYQILHPAEFKLLEDHYTAWNSSATEIDFDLWERKSEIVYPGAMYVDFKPEQDGTIQRCTIELVFWA